MVINSDNFIVYILLLIILGESIMLTVLWMHYKKMQIKLLSEINRLNTDLETLKWDRDEFIKQVNILKITVKKLTTFLKMFKDKVDINLYNEIMDND